MKWEHPSRRYGFTLIELMVAVVIIGILATAATISVADHLVTAKQNVARAELATTKDALTVFFMENGRYPSNEEGLGVLRKKTPRHPDGLLSGDLKDPWENPYVYVYPGVEGAFDLLSYGADAQEGGTGGDMDISIHDDGDGE